MGAFVDTFVGRDIGMTCEEKSTHNIPLMTQKILQNEEQASSTR